MASDTSGMQADEHICCASHHQVPAGADNCLLSFSSTDVSSHAQGRTFQAANRNTGDSDLDYIPKLDLL